MLARWRGGGKDKDNNATTIKAPADAIVTANGAPSPPSPTKKGKGKKIQEAPPPETLHEKRERIKKENLTECCNIFIFFIFLFIFTVAVILDQSASSSRLADHVRGRLDSRAFPIDNISSIAVLYDYLEQVFVNDLFTENSDMQVAREMTTPAVHNTTVEHPIDVSNRLVGNVRLRQVRVDQEENCQVSPMFSEYRISCYPPVESSTSESQTAFGPPDDSIVDSPGASSIEPPGRFTWTSDASGTSYVGYLGTYSANGFVQFLSPNPHATLTQIERLKADNFLDVATRAVFVDLIVWNVNVGTYAVVRLAIEFGASGGVKRNLDVLTMTQASLTPGGFGSATDWVSFFFFVIVILLVVFKYMLEEIQELAIHRLKYIMDGWNLMDWANMILLLVAFVMRMMTYSSVGTISTNPNQFEMSKLQVIASQISTVRLLLAFNAILLWLKVVKYLRHMPYLKHLIRTVWSAFDLFLPFLLMFCVVFVGFAWSYNIGFGDQIVELATFGNTFVYLCRAFLGDVRLMPAYEMTPAFGAVLILLFYVTLVLVGLSVLFAIIADSLFRGKYEEQPKVEDHLHEEEPLEEFYRYWHHAIKHHMKKRAPWLYGRIFGHKRHVHAHHTKDGIHFTEAPPGGDPALALTNGSGGKNNNAMVATNGADLNKTMASTGSRNLIGGWRQGSKPPMAIEDAGAESDSSSSESSADIPRPDQPSEAQLKSAIEHMSGRILSEVSIVGIEIKSELHDVCERVAQMQMAVEELTWRGEKIRLEQMAELGN